MKDLLGWFGLKGFPFDKNLKTQDVFETDSFKEAMARFDYIKRRGGILLLTGDPGVGKTLALRRYVDSLNENLFKPYYTPLSTLSRADLLYHLNRLLGLPPRLSKSAIYGQIQKTLLESKDSSGKTAFLIIDEAHLLQAGPLEELRLLTNFKMDSYDPFILVLSGQSDLKRIMEFAVMEPFNQRIAIRYHMPGLNPEQSAPSSSRLSPMPCSTKSGPSPLRGCSKSRPSMANRERRKNENRKGNSNRVGNLDAHQPTQ